MFASKPTRITLAVGVPLVLLIVNGCAEREPESVVVPDVTGKPLSEAAKLITEAGLYVDTPSEQHSSAVKAGYVIHQTQAAGDPVPPGAVISLVVSLGPSTPEPEEQSEADPPSDTTPEEDANETDKQTE